MKLIIQIPCYNEEKTLPLTIADLPKQIEGVDEIETLVIDDGSADNTIKLAKALNVTYIVELKKNKGLARAFQTGIETCLKKGADIIVNTDGDNQYYGGDIVKLVDPILKGRADVVIGNRETATIPHFSWFKKRLQQLGSFFIRRLSRTNMPDAVSGFRAYSRNAALGINVFSEFSYTIENLIQFGNSKVNIESVNIRTNEKLRPSRLFKNIFIFISRQLTTMVRAYSTYRALKVFTLAGIVFALPGMIGFIRFLYFFAIGEGNGHVQSLVFSTVSVLIGFFLFMFGIIADLISNNRKLIEQVLKMIKEDKWQQK